MSGPLAGKIALVTGASRGIGKDTALALAKDGATVVVNYVSSAGPAEEVVKEIGSDRAVAMQADVSKIESVKSLVDQVVKKYGRIDIMACNAGQLVQNGNLEKITEETWTRCFDVNVKGPLFLVQSAAPHMPKGGRIILWSTTLAAFSGIMPNYLLYASAKGAVEQMTRVLAKDLGTKGITVNCIAPGPVMTDAFMEGKTQQIIDHLASTNPVGRLSKPEEVADMVRHIASPTMSMLNGQIIRLNGGMSVG